ncbi:hypothetical protein GIB67_006580, partial [Kingdonia uniflora]
MTSFTNKLWLGLTLNRSCSGPSPVQLSLQKSRFPSPSTHAVLALTIFINPTILFHILEALGVAV